MPTARIRFRDGSYHITADEIADALRQEFEDYGVSLAPRLHGDEPHVHVTKAWNRAVSISINNSDGEMELEPTSPNNVRQMLLDLLIIPLLFTDGQLDASWEEMGEEVTTFLTEQFGARLN